MDDKRFDELIKRKVSEFQPSGFDASALAAFHDRISAVNFSPWHSRYQTELIVVSSVVVSTIIMLITLWLSADRKLQAIQINSALIESQRREIADLKRQVVALRSSDTVYLSGQVTSEELLLSKIARLERMIEAMAGKYDSHSNALAISDHLLPKELEPFSFYRNGTNDIRLRERFQEDERPGVAPPRERIASLKTLHALERHYHPGIGFRVGPVLEFSKGFYGSGRGRLDYAGGVMGDFVLSPAISVETGAKFTHRFYEIGENGLASSSVTLPNVNNSLGPLISADVDSWVLEIPVNLRYRRPISMRASWVAGIGYSSTIVTKQMFEYDYYLSGDASVRVNESHIFSKSRMYSGLLNASLSLSFQTKKRRAFETTLYYQHGLGEAGIERSKSNFIGIRSSYWFTLR